MQQLLTLDNQKRLTAVKVGNDPALSPIFSDDEGNWWLSALISQPGTIVPFTSHDRAYLPVFTEWWVDQMGPVSEAGVAS